MDIRAVIDWIILIGALVLAITNIINFVRKPSEKYKEKKELNKHDQKNRRNHH